ncbi:Two-component response regulator-like APRR7 [Raphanus sativus]|uniref:Two-component response regulator-like APRR7 n=1 Tax=Raphanus sativus TaxID=3726 RepID=A0A9W3D4G4_RAPSA|nr:two-component response regulator-like APRR7 [Raphanus sativus]KAJ4911552.1 Two-component response regulator-like APRR7 [Raphanus sativus]
MKNGNDNGEGSSYPVTDRKTFTKERHSGDEEEEEEDKAASGVPMDVRNGAGQGSSSPGLQVPLSQATVCWERFLHVRTIRVLLVENDDCTRYIVTALLRNCSYEVVEVANGVQAWKVLEDLNNHIDIVLTEVVMPYLSGVGLLCKILNHKSRRNIPVIMMSSHDSMGLIFKCLSKGAVDFLVKPIRKNELKILWQHVWRRCQSSSGSGSESGTHQTQKSVKSKNVIKSDNDSGHSGENENGSIGLNASDASSDGSGAQSSWTKKAVEVDDSPRAVSPWDRVDSTCAQVVHSNPEFPNNHLVAAPVEKETKEQDEKNEDVTMGRDLEISIRRNDDLALDPKDEPLTKTTCIVRQENSFEKSSSKWKLKVGKGPLDLNSESPSSKQMHEDGGSGFKAMPSHLKDNREPVTPNPPCKTLDTSEAAVKNSEELMDVEHSSKRHRGTKDDGTIVREDRNVLRRSEGSAFSRYNPAANNNKPPGGNLGSSPLHDNNCQDLTKRTEPACDCHLNMNESLPNNHHSRVGSNNFEMSSTTENKAFTKPGAPKVSSAGSSSVKQPLPCDHHHHHHHSSYNPVHIPERKLQPKRGSSNEATEGNNNGVNYSVNGSGSGSGHGSNDPYGSSNGMNAGGMNTGSGNGAGGSGDGSGSGSGSGTVADENKMSQREAALTKFRQKRKERCFRKKVRYQSRKKLAEQRPRVRGQFVRKTADGTNDNDIKNAEDS